MYMDFGMKNFPFVKTVNYWMGLVDWPLGIQLNLYILVSTGNLRALGLMETSEQEITAPTCASAKKAFCS